MGELLEDEAVRVERLLDAQAKAVEPIFEEFEADFGWTFVLGEDPVKHRLRDTLPAVFDAGRAYFAARPDVTGAELYAHMVALAREADRELGIGGFFEQLLDIGPAAADS